MAARARHNPPTTQRRWSQVRGECVTDEKESKQKKGSRQAENRGREEAREAERSGDPMRAKTAARDQDPH